MSIVVTKCSTEVVGPSEPGTHTGDIHLSSLDKAAHSHLMSWLLVFDKPIEHPVSTIREALSRALVHYYPISGRLSTGADGGEVITCTGNGQGVLFVGASANCAVELLSTALLKELSVECPEDDEPLMLMQVTEFSCGGYVVSLTWNHILADAVGMGQFLQAVGELSRGMPRPSIVPVRTDGSVLAARTQRMSSADFASVILTKDMPFLDLTVPSSLINRIVAEVSTALGERCTVFEAVVSVLWQCRARAVMSDDPATARLVFAHNVRGLVGAAEGYYGNCSIGKWVHATSSQLADGDTKDVVKLIRVAKQETPDLEQTDNVVSTLARQHGYNTLVLSSWRNIGLEASDFGGGTPARVMWYPEHSFVPSCVLCPPCKGKDGVNVLGRLLKKEHVHGFLHELEALAHA